MNSRTIEWNGKLMLTGCGKTDSFNKDYNVKCVYGYMRHVCNTSYNV